MQEYNNIYNGTAPHYIEREYDGPDVCRFIFTKSGVLAVKKEPKIRLVLYCRLDSQTTNDPVENGNRKYFSHLSTTIQSIKDEYTNIKVIGEERNDKIVSNVKKLLQTQSEETYILGFGFDQRNSTTILGFDENGKNKELHGDIYITNFGNNPKIAKFINKYFGDTGATVSYNSAYDALQTEFPL